jgi:hypothetical protein
MLCFIARKKISDACDGGKALPERIEKHIQKCDGCSSCFHQHQMIHDTLAAAKPPSTVFPPFLHRRILHALASEKPRSLAWSGLYIRTACAAAVIGLSLLLHAAWRGNHDASLAAADEEWGSFQSLETSALQLEQLIREGPEVLAQPLGTEMLLLREDLLTVAEKIDSRLNGVVSEVILAER